MRGCWLLGLSVVVACQGSDPADTGGEPSDDGPPPIDLADVTWHEDLRPVVDRSCLACHDAGGIGPIILRIDDGETEAPEWAPLAVTSVATGSMPPWGASDDCHPIAGSRALTDNHREAFSVWAEQGYRLGDPAAYVPPTLDDEASIDLGPPDRELTAEAPYAPSRLRPDDYHCLPLGEVLAEDLWLRGIDVVPDQADLVHHAILFDVPPESAALVAQRDAEAPGPGYPCFGGPAEEGVFESVNLYTFLPGNGAETLIEDEGRLVRAGSRLVMQVHYNTLGLPEGQAAPADLSTVRLWLHDQAPPYRIDTIALNETELLLPAGDPEVVVERSFSFGAVADVVGVMPHMHYLGRSLSVHAVQGDARRCVVDVEDWDFNWQQSYRFPSEAPFKLEAADTVQLTCVYDNSAANQPTVGGVKQEPRDVTWGEGTLDEMCLAYAYIRVPSGESVGCARFEQILEDCPDDDGACWLDGVGDAVRACGGCPIDALSACREEGCGAALTPLSRCLDNCAEGQMTCLTTTCATQAERYLACVGPKVRDGSCDPYLASCGIGP